MVPGAPHLPECLKADVYLPPHLVEELPDCHRPIAAIVQTFIEEIGIPTVNRYTAAAREFGWTFTQNPPGFVIPSVQNLALIPAPAKTGSAHYIFRGRPYGSLSLLASPQQPQQSQVNSDRSESPFSLSSSIQYFPDEQDSVDLAMINAAEKISDLESRLERATLMEQEYIDEIANLRNELAETYDTLRQQETMLAEVTENISHRLALPFPTPQRPTEKQRAVPSAWLDRVSHSSTKRTPPPLFASSLGYPEKAPSLSAPSSSHRSRETPHGTKPKSEKEIPNLGPATTEFLAAHNLTQFRQIITLIVTNNAASRWSTMLGVLSLPDNVRSNLLDVLAADLEKRLEKRN